MDSVYEEKCTFLVTLKEFINEIVFEDKKIFCFEIKENDWFEKTDANRRKGKINLYHVIH